jgi:RNA polymerase sigma-70 factor (ECF subfamily)
VPVATMCLDDDHALVGRFQAGEAAPFDELYARHIDRVYNIAYRLVGDSETARDICQEVFIRVYQNLGRFRFEAKFTTWLYTIVLNLARTYHRGKKWTPIDEIPPQASGSENDSMLNKVALGEAKRAVRRLLGDLPAREREALVLRHYEGLSCKEAAEVMQCAPETVRSLSFFAIGKLRDALRKEGYEV